MMIFEIFRFIHFIRLILSKRTDRNVEQLIKCTKRCGPLAIKLLQFILMRNNKLYDKRLEFVFENCDFHSFEETKKMYLEDFGKDISGEYDTITEVASGSIGQVYKCYNGNEVVAIKVKHPHINSRVKRFIKVIKIVCCLTHSFNKYHNLIIEYINNIETQLDFDAEAKNTILLKENWKEDVIVPEVKYYKNNFICMSYHEGVNYNELSEHKKIICSLYVTFFFYTSLLVHDFLHGDLHTGNWKLQNNTLVLYDCGVMCTTHNVLFNRDIMEHVFSGRFEKLLYHICDTNVNSKEKNKQNKRIVNCKKHFSTNEYNSISAGDRLRIFIDKVLEYRLCTNKNTINILNAFALIAEICEKSASLFNKYIGIDNMDYEIVIYIYIGILKKLNRFHELLQFFQSWMDSDPIHNIIYTNWLMENFGHTKAYILDDIIYKKINV